MKFIIAIIQPHRLDAVREKLNSISIAGLTVSEVRGYGRQKGHTGKIGDGKIFVLDIEQALRVRTGETGDNAL
jgi:nitrogen regulatory protein PII